MSSAVTVTTAVRVLEAQVRAAVQAAWIFGSEVTIDQI